MLIFELWNDTQPQCLLRSTTPSSIQILQVLPGDSLSIVLCIYKQTSCTSISVIVLPTNYSTDQRVWYSTRLRYAHMINFEPVTLTHSCLAIDDQQFLTVFIKCARGGSEKKNISCFSLVYGFLTLYKSESGSVGWPCSCKKRRFGEAPSKVAPITFSSHRSTRYTASQNSGWIFSPVRFTHVKWAKGNLSFVKRPLTMMTSMDFVRGWQAMVLSTPCNDRSKCSR